MSCNYDFINLIAQKIISHELHYYIFKDYDEILLSIANKIKPSIQEETVERLNSFLSKIFRIQIYKNTVFDFMEDEENKKLVYFSSEQLRNLLTNDYNQILDELEAHDIIKIEEKHYNYGKYYKLLALMDSALNSKRISASIKFKRVRNGLRNYYRSKYNQLSGTDKQVFNMLWKYKISLTESTIRKELTQRYPIYLKERQEYIENLATKKEIKDGVKIMSMDEYVGQSKFYHDYITMWNESTKIEKSAFVSVDSFGKRFHSIFTTLPSFIRKYVRLNGSKKIVSLDLHQSQPTLLSKILYDYKGENEFTDAVNSGDVYSAYPYERTNAKKQFLRSIFSNRFSKSFLELSLQFPCLGRFILDIQNSPMYRDGEVIVPYKNTSCLLQRTESIIFRKIWEKLLKAGIHFINVHDGIYVANEKIEEAKLIMESVLKKELCNIQFSLSCEFNVQ